MYIKLMTEIHVAEPLVSNPIARKIKMSTEKPKRHIPPEFGGLGSVFGIATGYGWMVRGSNPGGGEIFRTCPDQPWGPPILLCNGYRVFPGGKERPGRDADPSPPSSAMVNKE